jgi:hypothetical protein
LLAAEIPKYRNIDRPSLLKILVLTDKSAFASNAAKPLFANPKNLVAVMSSFASINSRDPLFDPGLVTIAKFVEAGAQNLAPVIAANPDLLAPFTNVFRVSDATNQAKVSALKIVQLLIPHAVSAVDRLFGDLVIAQVFGGPEIDGYVDALLHIKLTEPDFEVKVAQEFEAAVGTAKKVSERRLMLANIGLVLDGELFLTAVGQTETLQAILRLEPDPGFDVGGLCKLAKALFENGYAGDVESVRRGAETWPDGKLHRFVRGLCGG